MDSKKLKTDQPKTKAGQTRSLDIANLLFGFQTFYFSFVICNDGSIVDISRFLCVFFLIDGNFLDFFRLKIPFILLLRCSPHPVRLWAFHSLDISSVRTRLYMTVSGFYKISKRRVRTLDIPKTYQFIFWINKKLR